MTQVIPQEQRGQAVACERFDTRRSSGSTSSMPSGKQPAIYSRHYHNLPTQRIPGVTGTLLSESDRENRVPKRECSGRSKTSHKKAGIFRRRARLYLRFA